MTAGLTLAALIVLGLLIAFVIVPCLQESAPGAPQNQVVALVCEGEGAMPGYVMKGGFCQLLAVDINPAESSFVSSCPPATVYDPTGPFTCNVEPVEGVTYGCADSAQTRVEDRCYTPCAGAPVYAVLNGNIDCPATTGPGAFTGNFQEQVCTDTNTATYVLKQGVCQLRAVDTNPDPNATTQTCPLPLALDFSAPGATCNVAADPLTNKTYGCERVLDTRFNFRCYTPCEDGTILQEALTGAVRCVLPRVGA